ncbi:MAG: response regulator transcription factor [Myxococcota bacterium]
MTPRILLADDHAILRSGVRALIASTGRFEVVGEASNGADAIRLVDELEPSVVIIDIAMPQVNGLEALRRITARHAQTRVIVLSVHGEREYVVEALRAGASGYLRKDAAFEDLVAAIDTVSAGRRYLGRNVSEAAIEGFLGPVDRPAPCPPEAASGLERLSPREREVLALLARSHTNDEIAKLLHISGHTVQAHRKHVMEKLGIHRAIDLARFAIRHGIATLE